MRPHPIANIDFRVAIGGDRCTQPYQASLLNISAMSFGALSAHAIRALNRGAQLGRLAHDTGEGSIRRYHRPEQERSEEHTSEPQSLMRNSYALFCLKQNTSHLLQQYTKHQKIQ